VTPPAATSESVRRDGEVAAPPKALRARASAAYARQGREAVEQGWILDHLPLVRHVVAKVVGAAGAGGDVDDLISAGTVGLVKAARSYDPTRDSEFKTYAYIRIRGAVLDELRGRSGLPARLRTQMRRVRKAYEAHLAERGCPPGDEELAARLGIGLDQLYRTLQEARRRHVLSIHAPDEQEPALGAFLPPDGGPGPADQAERREMLAAVAEAIGTLPERDRLVVLLYYERDLTMKEVAAALEVTESRVSQIHASALFKLSMAVRSRS